MGITNPESSSRQQDSGNFMLRGHLARSGFKDETKNMDHVGVGVLRSFVTYQTWAMFSIAEAFLQEIQGIHIKYRVDGPCHLRPNTIPFKREIISTVFFLSDRNLTSVATDSNWSTPAMPGLSDNRFLWEQKKNSCMWIVNVEGMQWYIIANQILESGIEWA